MAIPAVLASALLTGSLLDQQVIGIENAPILAQLMLPVARVVADVCGIFVVGLLLISAFLLPIGGGSSGYRHLALWASWASVIWLITTLIAATLTLSEVFALPVNAIAEPATLVTFLTQISIGQVFLLQVLLILVIVVMAPLFRARWQAWVLVILALIAMGARGAAGHAGIGSDHETATILLGLHIAAVSLWVGGLMAMVFLLIRGNMQVPRIVSRFSALALWCVAAIAITGAIQAGLRLTDPSELFTSAYGQILLFKVELLAVLITLGWFQRARSVPMLTAGNRGPIIRLAWIESVIMAVVIGVSVTLSRTPITSRIGGGGDAHSHGLPPVPQSAWQFITEWRVDVPMLTLAFLLVGGYLMAVASWVKGKNRSACGWPLHRSAVFLAGLMALVIVSCTGIGSYAPFLLSDELPRTFMLLLVIPTALILGRPLTLMGRGTALVRAGQNPEIAIVALITFLVAAYGTRMTPMLMTNYWWRSLMDLVTLALGMWAVGSILQAGRRQISRPLLPLWATFWAIIGCLGLSLPSVRLITPSYFAGFAPPYVDNIILAQQVGVTLSACVSVLWLVMGIKYLRRVL